MTQIGTVTALGDQGMVQVTVARQTACGHDCENCAGWGAEAGTISVWAQAELPVEEGDRVELYSSHKILAVAALVYLVPVVLFLAGYLLAVSLSEPMRYACGGIGFALGLFLAVVYDRRVRREKIISYHVVRKF